MNVFLVACPIWRNSISFQYKLWHNRGMICTCVTIQHFIKAWILGQIYSLKEWLRIGTSSPSKWWSHHPWECTKSEYMWHFFIQFSGQGGVLVKGWTWWSWTSFPTLITPSFFFILRPNYHPKSRKFSHMQSIQWILKFIQQNTLILYLTTAWYTKSKPLKTVNDVKRKAWY